MVTLVLFVIALALVFDFLNGFHDAANSIATIVSTRVLTPRKAVVWAAFFNLVAALVFDVHIAKTIGKGLVELEDVTVYVIMAGLAGAIAWNLITWFFGIPSSSSHALMGGYGGAAIAKAGFGAIVLGGWIKTLLFIVLAPVLGMVLGYSLQVAVLWVVRKRSYDGVNIVFRRLQLLSAAVYSLGHGTNDAQKTMGIITGLLLIAGFLPTFSVPLWVILMSHCAIALGTLFGGWRIVRTMGSKITKLKPSDGFCAESAGGITLLLTAYFGIAVSTTHTIAGAIMGVGATKRLSAVRWGIAGTMIWAWILTIPASALVAAVAYYAIDGFRVMFH
ncbi:MAG TPA: inorganic phosphate transporter [Bacteroidota bacterium]|nr:inorganic phosphate transporter [Bacteroidota bacterium]